MAGSTSESFNPSPDETNQPLPSEPQQEAHASLTSSAAQSSEETSRKKIGRPTGSKNKSKPSLTFTKGIEPTIKTVRIEIPSGNDIVEMIEKFARRHRVGVNVENGTGYISNFAFEDTFFTSSGVYSLLMMTGTFMDSSIIDAPSSSSTGGALSSFPVGGPWLRVLCKGAEGGRVFGGIVAEKVMVNSDIVVVYATTFKSCGLEVLDPTEYATKGQQPVQYVGGSSSSSTRPSGGEVADPSGGLLGGGVFGGGIQQGNWGFMMQQQPLQHEGGHFVGSSGLSTHPSGGGIGGVGDSAGGLPRGGTSGGGVVLRAPTEQIDWDFFMGKMMPPS